MTETAKDSLEGVFEFRDGEINAEEIMARLRERIAARRAQAAAQGLAYDELAQGGGAVFANELPAPTSHVGSELAAQVAGLQHSADGIFVPLSVVGNTNPIAKKARMALHQLVIYYVNMLAGKQAAVNRANAQAMSGLLATLDAANKKVAVLEEEIKRMKSDK